MVGLLSVHLVASVALACASLDISTAVGREVASEVIVVLDVSVMRTVMYRLTGVVGNKVVFDLLGLGILCSVVGVVEDVAVYSDTLDNKLVDIIKDTLVGVAFNNKNIAEQIKKRANSMDYSDTQNHLLDIISLFE